MRHATPSVNLAFSPTQLAVVVALHVALAAVVVTGKARAVPQENAPLQVRMLAPEPLPVAPAPAVRPPAPAPKPASARPQTVRAPERPLVAAPATAPSPASVAAVEPSPPVKVAAAAANVTDAAPAPAPAPALTAPRFDADYLDNPAPVYPAASRRLREQGKVVLRVFVEPDGHASQVDVRTGSGSARLDDAAVDAVRRWRFVPARRGSEAVGGWVLVPLDFQLKG